MSRHLKLAFFLAVLAALVAIVWSPVEQAFGLVALQKAIAPHGSMTVRFHPNPELAQKLVEGVVGLSGTMRAPRVPDIRLQALLGASVDNISLSDVAPLHVEFAALLERFPRLESFDCRENANGWHAPEAEWMKFLSRAAAVPGLRAMGIMGLEVTDAALAPLAGHPTLDGFTLNCGRVTPACLPIFGSIPRLRHLGIENYTASTEEDWIRYCEGVRKLERLEGVTLGGETLRDAAIAQLAGHPALRRIAILGHDLTPKSIVSLTTLPRLTSLSLAQQTPPLSAEERTAITSALPRVRVEFLTGRGVRLK